ncbi:hypothetical protein OOK41_31525 [Micromonospora sp. NBC_01655]|uniref:hypothetical protein n=1 Tax=Micromonospora sp. NBC_01655 TaxID=2975983 RepID=UPI002256D4F6|nr:hypothetical protein [Micromonospora sp. NBC_01655]MCX4474792.1 hypothetical protein [Micromonospora sp. NBC_01655]
MQIPESIRPTIDAVLAWLTGYGQPMLFGAGVVAALLALALIWRFLRTGEVHEKLGVVAVSLATLFAMEGMFEVAHGPLGLNTAGSLMFCATFEVVMLHQGSLAAHKLAAAAEGQAPDITRHMRFVWLVAVASGVIASTASNSVTEVVLRLVTPPLAAGIWYMSLYADVEPAERQPSRWIWTPQRIGVRLGLLKPGAVDDLTEVFAQRRISALVEAGMELYVQQQAAKLRGDKPAEPSRWRRRRKSDPLAGALRRLQQLTKAADADTVQAAREQLRRVLSIETELFRDDTQPTATERELMDEIRISTRMTTAKWRNEVDQIRTVDARPQARHRMVHGVLMPAHIADQIPDQIPQEWLDRFRTSTVDQTEAPDLDHPADQIPAADLDQSRTTPVDQPAGPDRTSEVDQIPDQTGPRDLVHARTNPAPVDQPATSAVVPAVRTTPVQRTTARVDRARPVSPAAGGEVPPRIRDMVRDLKRAYRGDIPGRRTVMDRMRWTSAGDAQTAINLVRAERTKTTEES